MKISHFTALLLLGMLTAACSGDKNTDSYGGAEQNKPEASVSQQAESNSQASEPRQAEDNSPASEPPQAESKPQVSAPPAGNEAEASASMSNESAAEGRADYPKASNHADGEAAKRDEQAKKDTEAAGNKAAGKTAVNVSLYNEFAEGEKKELPDIKDTFDSIASMAADDNIPEDRIKKFKQCAEIYYKSVESNSPEHYEQHIQALEQLIASMRGLEAKGLLGMGVKACLCGINLYKTQYMVCVGEAADEELEQAKNETEKIMNQIEDEGQRLKTEEADKAR